MLSQARPGTRGVDVGRRANYEPPRQQPKIPSTAEASARCSTGRVLCVVLWPSHSCPLAIPVLRKDTPRAHTAAKHTQGVVPVSLCMAVASYSGHAACPVLPACMPQRRACVAWISGHPLRKAPTVDRTAPGIVVSMPWHGVAVCLYRLTVHLFPGIGVSRRGGGK